MKVYIVTEGEYSDYHICKVFDSRKHAEEYCALGHGENISEWIVSDKTDSADPVDVVYKYHVLYPSRGTDYIPEPEYLQRSNIPADKESIKRHWRHKTEDIINDNYSSGRYVYLDERNKSKALKIVRDRIAEAKALLNLL